MVVTTAAEVAAVGIKVGRERGSRSGRTERSEAPNEMVDGRLYL